MTEESFAIKLPEFEGPFDLLLFFIERDELDIHAISIAKITGDFLNYLHQMVSLDMEIASEFIFVAATLMRIKAKMLLPRFETDEQGNPVDHREELIQKLIAYKKIKQVCDELRPYEHERFLQEKRGNITADLEQVEKVIHPGEELQDISLYKLMKVYERITESYLNRAREVTHTIVQHPYSIESQKAAIKRLLDINSRLDFKQIAANSDNKVHFVYNFLAVLELLQQELIDIQVGLGFNNFWVSVR